MRSQDSFIGPARQSSVQTRDPMKDRTYWKNHYVIESDAEEIGKNIRLNFFKSGGRLFELVYFQKKARTLRIS